MIKAYRNILIVVKQTPYEQYLQLKAQGRAPVALRWERLKNRFSAHKKCVDDVTNVLEQIGINYNVIRRDELHRYLLCMTISVNFNFKQLNFKLNYE